MRSIARHPVSSKSTAVRALSGDRPPRYRRPAEGSVVDPVEVEIRELLRETPAMPATVSPSGSAGERSVYCR
ncbi:hypothetical protein [Streptomyces sp. NPDC002324]